MLQKIYRIARRLTRSRLRVEVIPTENFCVVRSAGLREDGLPEVGIFNCPLRLKDVASNLVLQIALNGSDTPESLADGKTIGGRFANKDQPLIEIFRLVRLGPDSSILRIADLHDNEGNFPHHLIATHLCATAGTSRNDALRLLLVSIEVWPKEKVASNAALGDYEFNPNNFWSWVDLGTRFSEMWRRDEAIVHWKTAVCMWPRGGKMYAGRITTKDKSRPPANAHNDIEVGFWASVTNDAIRSWCTELRVELPDSTLEA